MANAPMPVLSKVCHAKVQERNYTMHKDRLQNIKPYIDMSSPPEFPHIKIKAKKVKNQQERQAQIDRDNLGLLQRMDEVRNRVAHDKQNPDYSPRSLRADFRKREAAQIAEENKAILKRLDEARSCYSYRSGGSTPR
jgi:hypothetical protein